MGRMGVYLQTSSSHPGCWETHYFAYASLVQSACSTCGPGREWTDLTARVVGARCGDRMPGCMKNTIISIEGGVGTCHCGVARSFGCHTLFKRHWQCRPPASEYSMLWCNTSSCIGSDVRVVCQRGVGPVSCTKSLPVI